MANPIVKWVGGKRQLLPILSEMVPKEFGTYYEPFFGGGALFFALEPENAVINDSNPPLITMYKAVQSSPQEVKQHLNNIQNWYNALSDDQAKAELYYILRDRFNLGYEEDDGAYLAATLIFLNKAGYNGLYRTNRAGKYNVPFGHRKTLSLFDDENLVAVSKALQNADIRCGDFGNCLESASAGDFVFFDSPYYNTFDNYQAGGFSEADHRRLAETFQTLSERGVLCMLTNSNTDFIRELYKGFPITLVPVRRAVNRDASGRTGEELIITNY